MSDTSPIRPPVAIIGAGPAGLVTARWLKERGFDPVLYEASADLGGQWNPGGLHSATWPGMVTNTSRVMTAFSDLDHAPGTAIYPGLADMHAYLGRYADMFGLRPAIRFGARVERLSRASSGGWTIRAHVNGQSQEETFGRVVLASGRHLEGEIPDVAGMETFAGKHDIRHTRQYAGPERYRGGSVLVAGCSISALEIATDLAQSGAKVSLACRRQRYVLPKLIAGVPADHMLFTRAAALAGEHLPPEAAAAGLKAQVLRAAGSPEQYGALAPDPDIFAAGVTQCQGFLPAVAEGRITVRPWIAAIDGPSIRFADGHQDRFDAVLFGTGYRMSLPWLSPEIAATVELDGQGVTLFADSFHPDLDGLAFVGLYDLVGPYFPVLELQARYVAGYWAGKVAMPVRAKMEAGLAEARRTRGTPARPMHMMALGFARRAGVEPLIETRPQLERALLFGPLSPASFRLDGPDSLSVAALRTCQAAAAFGAICGTDFTVEEAQLRSAIFGQPMAASERR